MQPKGRPDYDLLHEIGIALAINMIAGHPTYPDPVEPPIETLWLGVHDNVLRPIPIRLLTQGVEAALPLIKEGKKVLVYCGRGRHRSVAMTACILIALGYSADEAKKIVKSQRSIADPNTFHIRRIIRIFEERWAEVNA